ncbi:MAG: glycosyltransferase [Bacteroidota bacterium]
MENVVFVTSTIVFLYSILILLLIAGFYKVPEETYETASPVNEFSIIIPFRNEEQNLERLIGSLALIEYPYNKFEVILVDDNSEDRSFEIANTLLRYTKIKSRVIKVPEGTSGKKNALNIGIEEALFSWIITTDADCTVQPLWVKLIDQKLQVEETVMLAGPVNMISNNEGFIDLFQRCDLAAMMGSTIGGFGLGKPFLCNGANLSFRKDTFYEVGGYEGNMNMASGDDLFLMEKIIKKIPNKVKYIKAGSAIVYTNAMETVSQFVQQRIRWAAKSSSYSSLFIKGVSLMIGLSNAMLLLLMIFAAFGVYLKDVLPFIVLKFLVDFWLLKISSNFLGDSKKIYLYPVVAITYPFYVVSIAFLSQVSDFEWKGRKFNK